jgi:hypothetical protein
MDNGRIIVEHAPSGSDLSDNFIKAVNVVHERGLKLYPGTKLVSRYGVIIVQDPVTVLEWLHAEKIAAYEERV